jgi:hypothetical protein
MRKIKPAGDGNPQAGYFQSFHGHVYSQKNSTAAKCFMRVPSEKSPPGQFTGWPRVSKKMARHE